MDLVDILDGMDEMVTKVHTHDTYTCRLSTDVHCGIPWRDLTLQINFGSKVVDLCSETQVYITEQSALNPHSTGINFSHQNLTSTDVRF